MIYFEPIGDTEWVLEINGICPWKAESVGNSYIWKKRSDRNWQVMFHNMGGHWTPCKGFSTDRPCSWDDRVEWECLDELEVFAMVI